MTIQSELFSWTQVLKSGADVVPSDGTGPDGTGHFVDREKLAEATSLFLAEFEGYKCRLTMDRMYWHPDPADQCFWDKVSYPAGRAYTDPVKDREGTILHPNGYLEVMR